MSRSSIIEDIGHRTYRFINNHNASYNKASTKSNMCLESQ